MVGKVALQPRNAKLSSKDFNISELKRRTEIEDFKSLIDDQIQLLVLLKVKISCSKICVEDVGHVQPVLAYVLVQILVFVQSKVEKEGTTSLARSRYGEISSLLLFASDDNVWHHLSSEIAVNVNEEANNEEYFKLLRHSSYKGDVFFHNVFFLEHCSKLMIFDRFKEDCPDLMRIMEISDELGAGGDDELNGETLAGNTIGSIATYGQIFERKETDGPVVIRPSDKGTCAVNGAALTEMNQVENFSEKLLPKRIHQVLLLRYGTHDTPFDELGDGAGGYCKHPADINHAVKSKKADYKVLMILWQNKGHTFSANQAKDDGKETSSLGQNLYVFLLIFKASTDSSLGPMDIALQPSRFSQGPTVHDSISWSSIQVVHVMHAKDKTVPKLEELFGCFGVKDFQCLHVPLSQGQKSSFSADDKDKVQGLPCLHMPPFRDCTLHQRTKGTSVSFARVRTEERRVLRITKQCIFQDKERRFPYSANQQI